MEQPAVPGRTTQTTVVIEEKLPPLVELDPVPIDPAAEQRFRLLVRRCKGFDDLPDSLVAIKFYSRLQNGGEREGDASIDVDAVRLRVSDLLAIVEEGPLESPHNWMSNSEGTLTGNEIADLMIVLRAMKISVGTAFHEIDQGRWEPGLRLLSDALRVCLAVRSAGGFASHLAIRETKTDLGILVARLPFPPGLDGETVRDLENVLILHGSNGDSIWYHLLEIAQFSDSFAEHFGAEMGIPTRDGRGDANRQCVLASRVIRAYCADLATAAHSDVSESQLTAIGRRHVSTVTGAPAGIVHAAIDSYGEILADRAEAQGLARMIVLSIRASGRSNAPGVAGPRGR